MSKARVLMLVENNAYPEDVRVRSEAQALRDAGFAVSVIAPRKGGQPWSEDISGVQVDRFSPPAAGNGPLGYAWEFGYATLAMALLSLRVFARRGFDVIHAANPPDTLWSVGLLFKLFGKRFVFDQHDLSPEIYRSRSARSGRILYWTLRLLERIAYAVADVVISPNESYKRVALDRGGKRPDKVFVVRNGPPLALVRQEAELECSREAKHLIGYVGTIGRQDGLDYLMRALHVMVSELGRTDFVAVVIGDGDALADVRALVAELGIERYVRFTGRLSQSDAHRQLSRVDVCVQPDPSNPLNDKSTMVKLMEYMALGKPTVAFDLPETRFSAGDAAVYARQNDVWEFAQRLSGLLDDPEQRRRLGEFGRRRVETHLAWEYSVPELRRAYQEGLGLGQWAEDEARLSVNRPSVRPRAQTGESGNG